MNASPPTRAPAGPATRARRRSRAASRPAREQAARGDRVLELARLHPSLALHDEPPEQLDVGGRATEPITPILPHSRATVRSSTRRAEGSFIRGSNGSRRRPPERVAVEPVHHPLAERSAPSRS